MNTTMRLFVVTMICCGLLVAAGSGTWCDQAAETAQQTQAVNMLYAQPPRPATNVDDAALATLVPQGWAITDKLPCQLDGQGPRELAIIMCAEDPAQRDGEWWLRYNGPSKVLILNENAPGTGPLAEFEFRGCAPAPDTNGHPPAALFTDDLNGDGIVELFARTQEYAGGSGGWIHTNLIKWYLGAYKHAGEFGAKELGGLYFLDLHEQTPGRDVVVMHFIWGAEEAHFAPHRYRAHMFGWANGHYVVIGDLNTSSKYDNPDDAFANLRRYLWKK